VHSERLSNRGSCVRGFGRFAHRGKGRKEGGEWACKDDDVPQMATSEAEVLRGRGSRRRSCEWPNRLLPLPLPLLLCVRVRARVGIGIIEIPPTRRDRNCLLTSTRTRTRTGPRRLRSPHRRRRSRSRSKLHARAHAKRGTHSLIPRADETQLSAHVDALVVRTGIRAREAIDQGEQRGRVVGAASTRR
jgi:hypothetical protein